MLLIRKNGQVSNVIRAMLRRSDTGQGLTGLTNASTGLIISTIADNEAAATAYTAAGATIQTITTLGTFAAPAASNCRFKEVDATNHPGLYEFQFADARFAVAGAKFLKVTISGAITLLAKEISIQLTAADVDDGVHLGVTALPNAAAGANTGLPVVGSQIPNANAGASGGLPTLDASLRVLANLGAILGTALTETAGQIAAAFKQFFNVAAPTGTVNSLPNAIPGASGGVLIAGTNAAATINGLTLAGAAAVGGTPGTAGLAVTGGAASTTAGGTAAAAATFTGGAGAATTNGAAAGFTTTAGGTTTVSGNDGAIFTGTGNGNGATLAHAGTGKDLNAQTTNSLQVDTRMFLGQPVVLDVNNFPKVDVQDWAAVAVSALPANFFSLAISAGGAVTVGTNNDKNGYSLTVAPPTTSQIVTAIFTDLMTSTDFSTAGSIGNLLKTNIDTNIGSRSTYAGGPVASVTGDVAGKVLGGGASAFTAVGVQADLQTIKTQVVTCAAGVTIPTSLASPTNITAATGVVLGATGLDQISVADPGGIANMTTLPKLIVGIFRRFYKKVTMTASQEKMFADDGVTVNVTQAVSDDGTTQTQGAGT